MNKGLPNYREHAARMTPLGEAEYGDAVRCRNYREVGGVGVVDIQSIDKGWIPMVCCEDLQPYYAREARKVVAAAGAGYSLVEQGRPDAIIKLSGSLSENHARIPRVTNKMRQLAKAERDLNIVYGPPTEELAWKSSAIHLTAKYDGVTMRADLGDEWYAMPQEWYRSFEWIRALDRNDGRCIGAAYFAIAPDRSEVFWCGTVQSYEDPKAKEYSIGNVLLMRGLELAYDSGADVFNLGLDLFDYKPQMWGTIRRWDTGLTYEGNA